MPNRILKESTFTSDKIAELSDFEFRLWVGLITQADDAGRGDARPAIIKGRVFALRDRVTVKDIDFALHALAAAGCVSLYTVGGKPYFQFPGWAKHQRIRDSKPQFPGPDEADENTNSPQLAATRGNSPQLAATRGLNPIQSNPIRIQSESESENARTREDDGFGEFWDAYPKKTGNIDRAYFVYVGVIESGVDKDTLIKAVKDQAAGYTEERMRYFPSAENWLKNRAWTQKADKPKRQKISNDPTAGEDVTADIMALARQMGVQHG